MKFVQVLAETDSEQKKIEFKLNILVVLHADYLWNIYVIVGVSCERIVRDEEIKSVRKFVCATK